MFSEDEMRDLAESIIALYYDHNFGATSKMDYETLLFSKYLDHLRNSNEPYDDYTVSKALGITQSRVRSLKERKELKYPYAYNNWKDSFAKELKNAKFDEHDHHVKFIVQDINVRNEARHYIEEQGWFDEYSLNRKLLNLPLKCFVDIFCTGSDFSEALSEKTKKQLTNLAGEDPSVQAFLTDFSKEGFKRFLMSASKEILGIALSTIPFGGTAKVAFGFLGKVIKGV